MAKITCCNNETNSSRERRKEHIQFLINLGLVVFCFISSGHSHSQTATDDLPLLDLETPIRMNFAGNWEKDFARSDDWQDELSRRMSIRQETAALQRSGIGLGQGPSISIGNLGLNKPRRRQANLFDLARLSEYINRSSTMEIFQNRYEVRIHRRGEAPLICSMETGPNEVFSSRHGTEI